MAAKAMETKEAETPELKAVVLVVPAIDAEDVSRMVAAGLSLNGYRHNSPVVIDWPPT